MLKSSTAKQNNGLTGFQLSRPFFNTTGARAIERSLRRNVETFQTCNENNIRRSGISVDPAGTAPKLRAWIIRPVF